MPRIDPQQLLSCLTPLLAVNGGIKSSGEVIRLANLMQKYSKKLVSKCIYIQILKCTETDLLGQFMAANGWNLVHTWLNDSVNSANWPFVQEILEMLLLCPVDSNRLKSNHTPKIVKNLSMNISQNPMITALSKKLVEQWLKIAHQEKQLLEQQQKQQQVNGLNLNGSSNSDKINVDDNRLLGSNSEPLNAKNVNDIKMASQNNNTNGIENNINIDEEDSSKKSSESIKYKISNNKDSGLVLSIKRSTSPTQNEQEQQLKSPDIKLKSEHKSKSTSSDKDKDKDRKKSSSSSSHKSSSSSSKSSHRDKDRSSSSSHKSSSSSSGSSSSSSKDRHHSSLSKSSSSKSSSSSSRDKDKERDKKKRDIEKEQAEKDKETLSFLTPLSSNKLQRIPKRQHTESGGDSEPPNKTTKPSEVVEKKKLSISIENRKGDKPKTVKTLNSQFRNHGLAEEPPPPPSRKTLKKPANNTVILSSPTSASSTPSSLTSSSTTKPLSPPPNKKIQLEKALELDIPERAGGVKLIKPKPMLVESTGFFDALDASAFMNKKDSKKRKRLPSGSSNSNVKKEEPESPKIEAKPLKFYKDTLEENADEDKEKEKEKLANSKTDDSTEIESPTKDLDISIDIKNENKGDNNDEESKSNDSVTVKKSDAPSSPVPEADDDEPEEKRPPGIGTGEDGPPGIIKIPNRFRKRLKRSIRWRSDDELVDIHYFPLEENERVNVTKTFMEQKHMEHIHERNALLGRRQDEQTSWRTLILVDNVPEIQYGSKSLEAKIQSEREKNTLQEVFFDGRSMSDSPQEPDFEAYDMTEPATIPLEDVTGNTDSITSFRDLAWPAPKGEQPQFVSHGGFGNIFNNVTPTISIPPAPVINPLAGLNLGALPLENPALNFMGIIQTAATAAAANISPFMQPPPMIQNNYQSNSSSNNSSNNNFNNRGLGNNANNYSTGNNNNNNNNISNNRNRSGSGGGNGSNWVRGNANQNMRRGMCHQYQRTGFCRNRNSGCPYIHER